MNCSYNNFKEEFPEVKSDVINLNEVSNPDKLRNWTRLANTQMKHIGFEKPLFNITENKIEVLRQNMAEYENYFEHEYTPRVLTEALNKRSLIEDLADDNRLGEEYKEMLDEVEQDIEISLYSTIAPDPAEKKYIPAEHVATYQDWKSNTEKAIGDLKRQRAMYPRNNRKYNDIKQKITESIESLESSLENYDPNDVLTVLAHVQNEMSILGEILQDINNGKLTPQETINIFEATKLDERMSKLEAVFTTGESAIPLHKALIFASDAWLSDSDNAEIGYRTLRNNFTDVIDDYKLATATLIKNIATDSDYMAQIKREKQGEMVKMDDGTLKSKWDLFYEKVQFLLSNQTSTEIKDGDGHLGYYLLGSSSYNSILVDILGTVKSMSENRESGRTSKWVRSVTDSLNTLNRLASFDDIYITSRGKAKKIRRAFEELLFEVDDFGNTDKNRIVSFGSDMFYKMFNNQGKIGMYKRDFYNSPPLGIQQEIAHDNWMEALRENTDILDARKILSLKDKYYGVPEFSHLFSFSETEMRTYEAEMRDKMGNTAFEIALEKQDNNLFEYQNAGFLRTDLQYNQNPLRFIEYFYSGEKKHTYMGDEVMLVPTYIHSIPKLDNPDMVNPRFKKAEEMAKSRGAEAYFNTAYKNLYKGAEYYYDTLTLFGIKNAGFLELAQITDASAKEGRYNRNVAQNFYHKFMETTVRAVGETFNPDIKLENPDSDKNYDTERDREFEAGLSDGVKLLFTRVAKDISALSTDHLRDMMLDGGMKIPTEYSKSVMDSDFDSVRDAKRQRMIDALVRQRLNRGTSADVSKRFSMSMDLAMSANSRKSASGIGKLLQDYADKHYLRNTSSYLKTYRSRNIDNNGLPYKQGLLSKIARMKPFERVSALRKLDAAEREAKKLMADLKEQIGKQETEDGYYNYYNEFTGERYFKTSSGYYKVKSENGKDVGTPELVIKDAGELYAGYIQRKINNMGSSPTVAQLVRGFAWTTFKAYLYVNPTSGINNRYQGYNQNNQAAASGLNGFTAGDLSQARKFIRGIGTNKMKGYFVDALNNEHTYKAAEWVDSKHITKRVGKKSEQWDIALTIAERMGMLRSIIEDLSGDHSRQDFWSTAGMKNAAESFLADFALNIPEVHNQMELLIAMMMNIDVEKKVGGKVVEKGGKLFDKNTQEFIFNHDMTLKDEYNTPNNQAIWVDLMGATDADGNLISIPHDTFKKKYIKLRNQLHGNYDSGDSTMIESYALGGPLSTTFVKWYFENYNNQWGQKEVDLSTGEIDVQGRKINLLKHTPTFMTHLGINTLSWTASSSLLASFATGLGVPSAWAVGVAFAPGAAMTAGILYMAARKKGVKFKDIKDLYGMSRAVQEFFSGNIKKEMGVTFNYMTEVLMRAGLTITDSALRQLVGVHGDASGKGDKIHEKLGITQDRWNHPTLSYEDRLKMSESAQELADNLHMRGMAVVAKISLGMAFLIANSALGSLKDWSDEELEDRLSKMDMYMNKVINLTNQLIGELEGWTNPGAWLDTATSFIMMKRMSKSFEEYDKATEEFITGEYSGGETLGRYAMNTLNILGVNMTTNKFQQMMEGGPTALFQDKGIYGGHTKGLDDVLIMDYLGSQIDKERGGTTMEEKKFKNSLGKERAVLLKVQKSKLRDKLDKQIKEYNKNRDAEFQIKIGDTEKEELVREAAKIIRDKNNVTKTNKVSKKMTNKELYDNLQEKKKAIEEESENFDVLKLRKK